MLLTRLIKVGMERLSDLYPDQEAREIVFVCMEHLLGTKRHTHILEPGYEVAEEQTAEVLSVLSGGQQIHAVGEIVNAFLCHSHTPFA